MKSKNVFFNSFTLQALISNLPTVVVSGVLPLLAAGLGLSVFEIGVLFLLARMGAVIGAQIGPRYLHLLSGRSYLACSLVEFFNLILSLLLFWSVLSHLPWAFSALIFLKGIGNGLMPNLRVTWLKNFSDGVWSKRVLLISQVILQVSYGAVGILLLLGLNFEGGLNVLLVDAATSVVGVVIFLFFSDRSPSSAAGSAATSGRLALLWRPGFRALWWADIFLALGMGGTNIFLVRSGENLFPAYGGYGLSLTLYAFAYLLGGLVIQTVAPAVASWRDRYQTLVPVFIILSFIGLATNHTPIALTAFIVLFFFYPIMLLGLEGSWFSNLTTTEIGYVSAKRALVLHCLWALGEAVYPKFSMSAELMVRASFIGFSAIAFFICTRKPSATTLDN